MKSLYAYEQRFLTNYEIFILMIFNQDEFTNNVREIMSSVIIL